MMILMVVGTTMGCASQNKEDKGIDALVTSYLKIKDALVQTDAKAAASHAQALSDLVNANAALSSLGTPAKAIAQATQASEQRESFKVLSEKVYEIVKESGSGEQSLYRQYCPMAFDFTGAYWLSNSEQVLNPYFGDQMLRCGKVVGKLD